MWHVKIIVEGIRCFLTQNEETCLSKRYAGRFDEPTAIALKEKYKNYRAQLVHDLHLEG